MVDIKKGLEKCKVIVNWPKNSPSIPLTFLRLHVNIMTRKS
jgi:hypothetical protein